MDYTKWRSNLPSALIRDVLSKYLLGLDKKLDKAEEEQAKIDEEASKVDRKDKDYNFYNNYITYIFDIRKEKQETEDIINLLANSLAKSTIEMPVTDMLRILELDKAMRTYDKWWEDY